MPDVLTPPVSLQWSSQYGTVTMTRSNGDGLVVSRSEAEDLYRMLGKLFGHENGKEDSDV